MAEVILFRHARGLTEGVRALAEQIEQASGHHVHTPDLFGGAVLPTEEEGLAHLQQIGQDEVMTRAMRACAEHKEASVVAGISMGVMPARKAAQTAPGFRACIAMSSALPLDAYARLWQPHTALQIHLAAQDPWVKDEDLPLARRPLRVRDRLAPVHGLLHGPVRRPAHRGHGRAHPRAAGLSVPLPRARPPAGPAPLSPARASGAAAPP
ncbi:hypothetical protein [Micrococcus porci]|uniref:hypothetical protein n=1 Tax=Micrococcus porci TaxID=2856555 RepID=UPI003CFA804E